MSWKLNQNEWKGKNIFKLLHTVHINCGKLEFFSNFSWSLSFAKKKKRIKFHWEFIIIISITMIIYTAKNKLNWTRVDSKMRKKNLENLKKYRQKKEEKFRPLSFIIKCNHQHHVVFSYTKKKKSSIIKHWISIYAIDGKSNGWWTTTKTTKKKEKKIKTSSSVIDPLVMI